MSWMDGGLLHWIIRLTVENLKANLSPILNNNQSHIFSLLTLHLIDLF
jgi:hypothetical protein